MSERTLPETYDLESMREALDDPYALMSAFAWSETPEGHEFWRKQRENGITEEGRAALTLMIAIADHRAATTEGDDYKAWYDEAILAANEAGYGPCSAADAIRGLAAEVAALREQMRYWKRGTDLINECLKTAARAEHGDAPFPLDHAMAKFWHNAQMEAFRHSLEMMGLPEDFGPVAKEVTA